MILWLVPRCRLIGIDIFFIIDIIGLRPVFRRCTVSMTQFLIGICSILLGVVGFGGRFLINSLIEGQKEMNHTLKDFVDEVRLYHSKNDLEIEKLHNNIKMLQNECNWRHLPDRRRRVDPDAEIKLA